MASHSSRINVYGLSGNLCCSLSILYLQRMHVLPFAFTYVYNRAHRFFFQKSNFECSTKNCSCVMPNFLWFRKIWAVGMAMSAQTCIYSQRKVLRDHANQNKTTENRLSVSMARLWLEHFLPKRCNLIHMIFHSVYAYCHSHSVYENIQNGPTRTSLIMRNSARLPTADEKLFFSLKTRRALYVRPYVSVFWNLFSITSANDFCWLENSFHFSDRRTMQIKPH